MAELTPRKRNFLAAMLQQDAAKEMNETRKGAYEAASYFLMGKHSLANARCPREEELEDQKIPSTPNIPTQDMDDARRDVPPKG